MTLTQNRRPSADRVAPPQSLADLKRRHKRAAVMALVVIALGPLSALSFVDTRFSALEDRGLMTRRLTEARS